MKSKIAVLNSSPNLAAAMQAILTPYSGGAEFVLVDKMSEIPTPAEGEPHAAIASIGVPNYPRTDRVTRVKAVNTKYVEDPTQRQQQWDLLRNHDAPTEMLVQELAGFEGFTIVPDRIASLAKLEYGKAQSELAEADSVEAQLEALTKMHDALLKVSAIEGNPSDGSDELPEGDDDAEGNTPADEAAV